MFWATFLSPFNDSIKIGIWLSNEFKTTGWWNSATLYTAIDVQSLTSLSWSVNIDTIFKKA